jgi:predicted DNA-binding transcriptional regulator YafY
VPKQRLLSEAEDCLMVSTQIAHENQLLPIVRYWIPDVEIIEPNDLKKKNEKIIFNFIDGYKNEDFR